MFALDIKDINIRDIKIFKFFYLEKVGHGHFVIFRYCIIRLKISKSVNVVRCIFCASFTVSVML